MIALKPPPIIETLHTYLATTSHTKNHTVTILPRQVEQFLEQKVEAVLALPVGDEDLHRTQDRTRIVMTLYQIGKKHNHHNIRQCRYQDRSVV